MNTSQKLRRTIAMFFLFIFLPTLVPTNLYASNNGPNAFEAASFEPVDAADIVNLATGDLSYVMPLLNVPSPEGGYPLALSYKAGVAMDQEASWVGMGWSLNPGAINRFVNGYADDMSFGIDHGFVYDKGQELDMYNIGLGANIAGITAGLGAYWGSNRTFGGSVTLGYGPAVGTFTGGSGGAGFTMGYANTVEDAVKDFTDFSLSTFKKKGNMSSTGASSQGMGLNSISGSATVDDYNVSATEKSFALSFGAYFYYGHRRVSYNLFKQFTTAYAGQLYADNPLSNNFSILNKEYYRKFDIGKVVISDGNMLNLLSEKRLDRGSDLFLLPSKDRFIVNAQGISGRISSVFNEEFRLADKYGNYTNPEYNEASIFEKLVNDNVIDYDMKLNSKLFFEFEGQNSSFLRIDRGNIVRDLSREATISGSPSFSAFKFSKTNSSNLYNENVTPDGHATKVGNRKRTGKYVEALTNQQILTSGASLNFIESKNLNRSNAEIYLPESIGGFKITDIDGKTYHYSLPVINFETWYKNYKAGVNENDNFYENERDEPYVTDWLLTAVTGPDYVDTNNDNKLDKGDYGYWVELEYGKWSDGYIWQTNSGQDELVKGDINNPDRSEYYRGRKQIYYLDAIKTRTHTAYFVKSLRQDAVGKELKIYNQQTTSVQSFNKLVNSTAISSNQFESCAVEDSQGHRFWTIHPDMYSLPKKYQSWDVIDYRGFRKNYVYRDFPKHYSLKLDKIILVKNDAVTLNKGAGIDLVTTKKAYSTKTIRAFKITDALFNSSWHGNLDGVYTSSDNPLREIDVNSCHNVLDVNDLKGIAYKQAVVKEVDFTFDPNYTLKPNSNTSDAANKGNLTLQKLSFLGKETEKYLPDYEFAYKSAGIPFDARQEDDWGYHKTNPEAWSLAEIRNPLGSKVNIEYEADDYSNVGVVSSRLFSKGIRFAITKNTTTNKLVFKVTRNTHVEDNVIDDFTNFRDYFTVGGKTSLDMFICRKSKYGGGNNTREARLDLKNVLADVTDVADDYATFELPDSNVYWDFIDQDRYWILNRIFSLDDVRHISSGNLDGVIMRNSGERKCPAWRNDYDNDDVNFHYKLASTKTPYKGSGGGLRVKDITVKNNGQVVSQQKYCYNSPGSGKNKTDANYVSSGSTSYVPFKYQVVLPYASLLPGANVLYQNVVVQDYGANGKLINTAEYQFNTYGNTADDPNSVFNLGDKLHIKKQQDESIPISYTYYEYTRNDQVHFKRYKIENWFANIGSLVSIKNYNKENQLLNSKKFTYKTNLDVDGTLGVSQESFMTKYVVHREPIQSKTTITDHYTMSVSDVKYPSVLASVESQSGGQIVRSYFDKYDFLTGIPLETRTEIVGGKSFKSKSLPAYVKYGKMGSKVDNADNRNMLSQTAAGYSYIYDPNDAIKPWKETGVGITTWSNDWIYQSVDGSQVTATTDKEKIWRKHKTIVWDGVRDSNGIFQDYNQNVDNDFWTIGVGSQPLKWRQISEITGYNHYSIPLEVKNVVSDAYAATKMGVSDTKVICEGSAKYNELYYSGIENIDIQGVWLEPGMYLEGAGRDNTKSHTGNYCVTLSSLSKLNIDLIKDGQGHKAGKYKLNVWVHKDNASNARVLFNGTTDSFNGPSKQAGDWILKTHYLTLNGSTAEKVSLTSKAGTTVSYDDIMLRPITSSATGYVYNERDELVFVIGNNGLGSQFWYDKAGRLVKTYVEVFDDQSNGLTGGFKLSSENKMHYKNL